MCDWKRSPGHHLENLEADRYDLLPVPVYLRAYLMAIARELRLDCQKVARSYLDLRDAGLPPDPRSRRTNV